MEAVDNLGYVIYANGVHMELEKVDVIVKWPELRNLTEVQ